MSSCTDVSPLMTEVPSSGVRNNNRPHDKRQFSVCISSRIDYINNTLADIHVQWFYRYLLENPPLCIVTSYCHGQSYV